MTPAGRAGRRSRSRTSPQACRGCCSWSSRGNPTTPIAWGIGSDRAVPMPLVGLHKLVDLAFPGRCGTYRPLLEVLLPTLDEQMKTTGGDAKTLRWVRDVVTFFLELRRQALMLCYVMIFFPCGMSVPG